MFAKSVVGPGGPARGTLVSTVPTPPTSPLPNFAVSRSTGTMSGRRELSRQEQIHRYFPQRSVQGAACARALEAQRRADLVHQEVEEEDM